MISVSNNSIFTPENINTSSESSISIILKNMRCGSLEIILPDSRSFIFRGIEEGPKGIIFVKNNDFFSRLVREGENGFPESYMDGWWDTPDLLTVLDVIFLNNIWNNASHWQSGKYCVLRREVRRVPSSIPVRG